MDQAFHQRVLGLKPKQVTKPSTFWVAVLKADSKVSGSNTEEDFLWIKCHGGIKAGVIRDQYELKNPADGKITLKLGPTVPTDETMRELDHFKDQLIVFEVVKAAEPPSHTMQVRSPLQPTINQMAPAPSSNRNSPSLQSNYGENLRAKLLRKSSKTYGQDENRNPQPGFQSTTMPRNRSSSAMPLASLAPNAEPFSPPPSVIPKAEPFSPPGETSNRPDWAMSNGFNYYVALNGEKMEQRMSHVDKAQVKDLLLDTWLKMPSEQRRSYEDTAKSNSSNRDVKLEPIKAELKVKDLLPVDKSTMSSGQLENNQTESFQLQTLLKEATPEMLETSVEEGVRLLDGLKDQMLTKGGDSSDTAQWIQQIENLRGQAVKTRTVIGVVGNTGAGKSSVINAMLDEERLLPTNCMRACTAVVTEVSYNDGEKPYRAKIEFIKLSDWEKELKTLFQDLIDGNGNVSRESSNPDTDAGIAYAKMKAVYPAKSKEAMAKSSIEKMLAEVSHVLGTSKDIEETDSLRFYQRLQHYVDSKEKSTGDKEKDKKKERREMEYWPLIRVVRIYVKSPALSTGAVIVDLPGVHDSNAARAAVAENYMKECTGLWIVAPITRAVDDKAAKSLLGESFKRQLKMDGGFSTITFICSKTDDISLMEAQESLGLDDEMGDSWLEIEEFSRKAKSLTRELDELKDSRAVYGEMLNDADEQIEVWETLKSSVEEGKICFPPKAQGLKKKRKGNTDQGARKKQRRSSSNDGEDSFDDDYENSDESEEEAENSPGEEESGKPLTEEQVNAKIMELRETKKEARRQRLELSAKMTSIRKDITEAAIQEKKIEARMSALCISGRNHYSKGAIQHDFAAGIKELDQEVAAEEDEENFDPDMESRDYDEVARSLPVFCVSSRGYQKLQGRLRKDPTVPGFETIEETEIPQLQAHCKQLTGKGRAANCKRFINNLSQLLNSLAMWASNDGTGANMTPEQMAREERYLHKGLKELESGLDKVVQTTCAELREEFKDNIFDKFGSAIASAAGQASQIAHRWGSPVNRENRAEGGYCWSTYKAICRRNGVYANAQGPHEWNHQLIEPMMKLLASGWEKTFARRLPLVLTVFTRDAAKLLKEFHRDVNARASKVGAGAAGLRMLQQQLGVYENILKDLATTVKETVNTTQKDINREFTPVVERAMAAAYEICVAEAGPGSYARMKYAMNTHVDQERHVMFQQSADEAERRLMEMIKKLSETMSDRVDEVFIAMRRDYRSVLSGGDSKGEVLPKSQRLLRKDVREILEGVERLFKKALGQEIEDKWKAEGEEKKLKEYEDVQEGLGLGAANIQNSGTNDKADGKLKTEQGGDLHQVPMHHIPGQRASSTENNQVSHNQDEVDNHHDQDSNCYGGSDDESHPSLLDQSEQEEHDVWGDDDDEESYDSAGTGGKDEDDQDDDNPIKQDEDEDDERDFTCSSPPTHY